MAYKKRIDGRGFEEPRKIEAKVGVIKRATGSAYFKFGNTWAYAAVYGPRELYPRFLQDPSKGILRVNYNMMPFSSVGDRVRPGGSRRSKEISMVTKMALLPVLDLNDFPNAVIDVFIELPETEAGSRVAGINAASMALADAGIKMKDLVTSVALGRVDDKLVVDVDYSEESYDGGPVADIPLAILPNSGKISLLQMDGLISKDNLVKVFEMGKKVCGDIKKVQQQALKDKYQSDKK